MSQYNVGVRLPHGGGAEHSSRGVVDTPENHPPQPSRTGACVACLLACLRCLDARAEPNHFQVRTPRGEMTSRDHLHVVGGYQHCIATWHRGGVNRLRWRDMGKRSEKWPIAEKKKVLQRRQRRRRSMDDASTTSPTAPHLRGALSPPTPLNMPEFERFAVKCMRRHFIFLDFLP